MDWGRVQRWLARVQARFLHLPSAWSQASPLPPRASFHTCLVSSLAPSAVSSAPNEMNGACSPSAGIGGVRRRHEGNGGVNALKMTKEQLGSPNHSSNAGEVTKEHYSGI